jgi:hypothetical protein
MVWWVQVFALGGLKGEADAANSSYFAVSGLLAKSVAEAARFIVDRGALAEGGPLLVRLLTQIASRFGTVVGQKFAAQAIPRRRAGQGGGQLCTGDSASAFHGAQTGTALWQRGSA